MTHRNRLFLQHRPIGLGVVCICQGWLRQFPANKRLLKEMWIFLYFGFFGLAFVDLQFALEFVNQLSKAILVLLNMFCIFFVHKNYLLTNLVFFNLEVKLLNTSLNLAVVLVGFLMASLFTVKFLFKGTDSFFQFGNDLKIIVSVILNKSYFLNTFYKFPKILKSIKTNAFASLQCSSFGFIQADLHLLELDFQALAQTVNVLRVLLFLSQFLSQTGSLKLDFITHI